MWACGLVVYGWRQWHCCKYSVEPSSSIKGGKLLTSWPPASFSRNLFWGIIFVAVITSRCLKFVTRIWSYATGFILFYVTLHLSVTAFMVSLRHDIQTIMYWEIGKMNITDPVRDLLALLPAVQKQRVCQQLCGT